MWPRISIEVSYNRRWFGNFFVTDNLLTTASDYNQWAMTLPQNPELPGVGSTARYFAVTQAAANRGAQNYQTFETDYAPARTQYWHGASVNLTGRMSNGLMFQGGTTTGHGVRDTCALMAATELYLVVAAIRRSFCSGHESVDDRGLVACSSSIDVLVSAGMQLDASAVLETGSTSASGGTSLNANTALPHPSFSSRDLRRMAGWDDDGQHADPECYAGGRPGWTCGSAVFKFGGRRADAGIDLYNLFNTSDPTGYLETYDYATNGATYLRPNAIVAPRFLRFNVTFNF